MIQVNLEDYAAYPLDLHSRGAAVLLSFRLDQVEHLANPVFSRFQHFHLRASPFTDDDVVAFARLILFVGQRDYIKSLSLPASLSPDYPLPLDLSLQRDDLLAGCKLWHIDVVERPLAKKPEDNVGVSREFWEYAKEMKRKKLIEAVGASASRSG
jgi:hypothetical protein